MHVLPSLRTRIAASSLPSRCRREIIQSKGVEVQSSAARSECLRQEERRCISSTSAGNPLAARRNKPIQKSWKRAKNRLLDVPISELTPVLWYEAEQALKKTNIQPDSIASSLTLLDRLHQEALDRKTREEKVASRDTLLSIDSVNWVVNTWRLCAAQEMSSLPISPRDIVQRLESYIESGLARPNVQTYSMIIDALQYTEDPADAPIFAESLIERMLQHKDAYLRPNNVTVSSILHLWSKSGQDEATSRAEYHLETLKGRYNESKTPDLCPDTQVYAKVISTWARSGRPNAGRRAAELLLEAKETPGLKPNSIVYSAVLDAMAKSGEAEQAHALLNEMMRLYSNGDANVQPDVYAFSCVLAAYANVGQAKATEGLLGEMEVLYEQTGDEKFRPNTVCYSILIGAFAANKEPRRAEGVLKRMMESPYDSVKPNIVSFNQVLHAWSTVGGDEGAERATVILERMETMNVKGESPLKPNGKSYNVLLDCYANSANLRKYAPVAQSKLEWMHRQNDPSVRPSKVSYNTVLRSWSKAGAPQKAEALLRGVCQMHRDGKSVVVPHVDLFTTVVAGWASSRDAQASERVELLLQFMEELHQREGLDTMPNCITYNAYLDCLARSRDSNAAERAEHALRRMQERYKAGVEGLKPDVISFTSVITAWSRSRHRSAPDQAEALFREMQESDDTEQRPNIMTYNALMSTFARHSRPFKVATVYDDMEERYKAGDSRLKPNFFVYTTLLQSWAKAAEPERAANVLQEMILKFESGDLERQPDTRTFNTVLQAWYRSSRPDAADKAEDGLEMMHSLAASNRFSVRPDLFTYSCVISAHARSGRPDSAVRAHHLLQRLHILYEETGDKACQPDLRVYSDVIILWTKSTDLLASERMDTLILGLSKAGDHSWKEQGLVACRRILEALAKSLLPNSLQHAESLGRVMAEHGLYLDLSTMNIADKSSTAHERHPVQKWQ